MPSKLSIALAQLNPTLGDISGNIAKLRAARASAHEQGSDLVMTTELFLSAYPPEDLVLKPSFQESLRTAVERLAQETSDGGPGILLGAPWRENGKLFNAMILLDGGKIVGRTLKYDLPNYGPFDEKRIFAAAPLQPPLDFRGCKLGVMICEDMWTPTAAAHLEKAGAEILLVPNGSPFEVNKTVTRRELALQRVKETGLPVVYLNQLGGQDELVFDGASFAIDGKGTLILGMPAWQEDVSFVQLEGGRLSSLSKLEKSHDDASADMYQALMLSLRDYVTKNGFPGIVLGMSGGIDSALVATIAVDALGPDKVWGVMLPSPFTSSSSTRDAKASAKLLGCKLDSVPISKTMKMFDATLKPLLGETLHGVVQENIQSRSRGLILMALSNAKGHMVLSTGNKSEMSVGYATLYGDMCGGFAVLKDVYKTQVYKISEWRNAHKPKTGLGPEGKVIPVNVLTKAPTAELRPDQKDTDSLPSYDILDGILQCLIEDDLGMSEIVAHGYDPVMVAQVWSMLDKTEYKRRQAAPGVKITPRNLSRDRRYPITNKYRERATSR